MATNTPAKRPDIIRFSVGAAAETALSFHGVPTVIGFHIQAVDSQAIYIGLTPGSTFSPDNYYTLKSTYVMIHRDINWTPAEEALYLRSSSGTVTVEIWYWG